MAIDDINCPKMRTMQRLAQRELGGFDDALRTISRDPAVEPSPERIAQSTLELARVVRHLGGSPQRLMTRIDALAADRRITPNMVIAARYYAVAAAVADGPSAGVSSYGTGSVSASPYNRLHASDERMMARVIFKGAQMAAFGMVDISGNPAIDELSRSVIEPILLGSDRSRTMTEVGRMMSTYSSKDGCSTSGTTEVHAVLRRLRSYFRLADD